MHKRMLLVSFLFIVLLSLMGSAQAVTPIDYGETLQGSIDSFTEMDTYTISGSSEDTVLIRMRSSWVFGPEIKLYAPNGTLISHATGSSYFSEITHVLPDIGEYTILVGDDDGDDTGNYSIFIQRVNNPGNAIPLGFGENRSASIDIKAEMDTYTISGSSEDTVLIRMRSSWVFGPEIKFYAPNGTLISHATGSSYFSEITHVLPDTGKYTILVGDDDGDDTGNYSIFIQRVNNPRGDFSGDGITDAWDITYLARHIAGIPGYEILHSGDISGDGMIDAWDITYLARAIAGISGYNV